MQLIPLPANRPASRFYRGGPRIAAFRGGIGGPEDEPEDWVASVTTVAGEQTVGLTRLPDGRWLADAIRADPGDWLGPEHLARYGSDPRLLVKLLDAGQRLPVHAHPDGDFAAHHLGRAHGKTEAWYILEGGEVHLGLTRDVDLDELTRLTASQDTEALLALLHRRRVDPGTVVLVPAGTLHAIGEGVLLVELQEPEDLSILLEWRGFDLDGEQAGHLGLGFDTALDAVERRATPDDELDALIRPAMWGPSVLPEPADPYFRLERRAIDGAATLEPGFAVLVVADGELRIDGIPAPRGSTVLAPHGVGAIDVTGYGELLACRPPRP